MKYVQKAYLAYLLTDYIYSGEKSSGLATPLSKSAACFFNKHADLLLNG